MIDKINRIFAAFAKVNAVTYLLVGGFFTALLYTILLDAEASIGLLRLIGYAWIFANLSYFISRKFFYERYELGGKLLRQTNSGMILRDTYFYTKINSDITYTKKLAGYIYVVLRVWSITGLGFILFFLPVFCIKKGLGF